MHHEWGPTALMPHKDTISFIDFFGITKNVHTIETLKTNLGETTEKQSNDVRDVCHKEVI